MKKLLVVLFCSLPLFSADKPNPAFTPEPEALRAIQGSYLKKILNPFREEKDSAYLGINNITFENQFGIFGDSVVIDSPKMFIDGKLVVCHCGKPAIGAVIRHGKCVAYCLECAPRRGMRR